MQLADPPREQAKRLAAEAALELVEDGMLLGIGSGSTVKYFISGLGRLIDQGFRLRGVASSKASAELARAAGITLQEEIDQPLQLAVDGADQIAPNLDLIKGGGGALLREKLVAMAAQRLVIIADESKLVSQLGLGHHCKVPVEVLSFLWRQTAERISSLGCQWELRGGLVSPFITDNGNLLLDLCWPGGVDNPAWQAAALKAEAGVVEHGFFLGLASSCIVANSEGVLRSLGV
ncbi:MAG: ribose-5-phosphate isomerase RpiA, partial [Candidatus Dormibacteraceae bacterium]